MRNLDQIKKEVENRIESISNETTQPMWVISTRGCGERVIGKVDDTAMRRDTEPSGKRMTDSPSSLEERREELLSNRDDVTIAAIAHDINNLVEWMSRVSRDELIGHIENSRQGESCISGVCGFTKDDVRRFYDEYSETYVGRPKEDERDKNTIYMWRVIKR